MSEQNYPAKKDNKGFLFVNGNKNQPKQPDQTGRIVVDGKEYRISAWESTSNDGKKYLSLALTPYFPPQNQGQGNSHPSNNTHSNGDGKRATPVAPIMNDFDFDIDKILNSGDD